MPEQKKTKTASKKKGSCIDRLEALGNDLVSHFTQIGSSWQDFCTFLNISQEDPQLDTKRLRDFIAAYHELFRALLDVQPPKQDTAQTNAVVVLPAVLQEDDEDVHA